MKPFPIITPEEAVEHIGDGATVGFSGFTSAGTAKAVPAALADKAKALHLQGRPFKLRVLTGASCGEVIDGVLARAGAIAWRGPFQSTGVLREQINREEVEYVDMHLSHLPQTVGFGFFGKVDFAVIEATEVTPDGRVFLTTSIGASPTYLHCAERVIIEVNHHQSVRLREMADIAIMPPPLHRSPIMLNDPLAKIGWEYAPVDPKKVIGIVEVDAPDVIPPFTPPDKTAERIADHIIRFLLAEKKAGRIPPEFLPLQAGVGNVSNGVMAALGRDPDIPPFKMFSEVFQDSCVPLMEQGRLLGASACALTVGAENLGRIFENMDFFAPRIVLRPQEFSNNPGLIRRLGVIAMNTALEIDIYGNCNSTHVYGANVMNGIGGSGDFCRNAYLSIVMCPSINKGGKISAVVPMCPHVDNSEHSVTIVVTEQGLADLRGLGPMHRANAIINNCAHPAYRPYLRNYLETAPAGHIRHNLDKCFELHRNLLQYGAMLPNLDFGGGVEDLDLGQRGNTLKQKSSPPEKGFTRKPDIVIR